MTTETTGDQHAVPWADADHVRIHPGVLHGVVDVPGDKSLSHRALILGAMVGETVSVAGLANSGDVAATAGALRTLGATVALQQGDNGNLAGTVCGPLSEADQIIDCGNSGTSLRLLAGVAAGIDGVAVFTGDGSLRRRPVDRVAAPLRLMGATVRARGGDRLPPMVVLGGGLRALDYMSPVASAQVKSCVLLAGLSATGTTTVTSPAPSRDHTERMMGFLGGDVRRDIDEAGQEIVSVQPGPLQPATVEVARDPSSAAFWIVAAILATDAVTVTVRGVSANPTRTGFVRTLEAMGAQITASNERDQCGEPVVDWSAQPSALSGAELHGAQVVDAIDEIPILALAGAVSDHGLHVRDAQELRVKESDRIDGVARLLAAVGAHAEQTPDGLHIPGGQQIIGGGVVDAHGDHRIAMTAAVAASIAQQPVDIVGFGTVASSYPGFLADFARLGGKVEVRN